MQGTQVRSLVQEDSTCHGATKPTRHSYWACVPRTCALQEEGPLPWEAQAPQWRVALLTATRQSFVQPKISTLKNDLKKGNQLGCIHPAPIWPPPVSNPPPGLASCNAHTRGPAVGRTSLVSNSEFSTWFLEPCISTVAPGLSASIASGALVREVHCWTPPQPCRGFPVDADIWGPLFRCSVNGRPPARRPQFYSDL